MYWLQYPRLTFEADTHTYKWDGKVAQGYSGIMQSVATKRKTQDGKEYFVECGYSKFSQHDDTNRKLGSAVHKIFSGKICGKIVHYPESIQPWVDHFDEFLKEYPLTPLVDQNGNYICEYPIYHEKLKYCGTLDLLAWNWKHELCLIDWKTSAVFERHYHAQTAAYAQLVEFLFKLKVKNRIVVRITDKEQKKEERVNKPEDFIWFNSVHNVLKMAA